MSKIDRHNSDKCVVCFSNSHQQVCEFCNAKMHVECMFVYISESNNMMCPQCRQGCIGVKKRETRNFKKSSKIFKKEIGKLLRLVEKHSGEHGLVPSQNSVDVLLLLFSYIKDHKYQAIYFSIFLFIAKQKLLDAIRNSHMSQYSNHSKLSIIYASMFKKDPKFLLLAEW